MTAYAFTDQRGRIERIVEQALAGATYVSSRNEEPRMLVLEARRADGKRVTLRFRGLRDSEANETPAAGAPLRLRGVDESTGGCVLLFVLPFFPRIPRGAARVRIDAGATKLNIVCEDAEWWEDPAPDTSSGSAP